MAEQTKAASASTAICGEHATSSSQVEGEVIRLFDHFRERLLRYLICFGLSVSDGEDIVQEVFLALFHHLERDKPRHNLDGWLFRVAHNLALKRREQIRRSGESLSDGGLQEGDARDYAPTPEQNLAYRQTQERLRAVFKALPEQDSRCLALRAEGLRYRQIAQVLDISLGAVSLSLVRSLARLTRVAERD